METVFGINVFLFPSRGFHVTVTFCPIQSAGKHSSYLEDVKCKTANIFWNDFQAI